MSFVSLYAEKSVAVLGLPETTLRMTAAHNTQGIHLSKQRKGYKLRFWCNNSSVIQHRYKSYH